MMYVTSLRGTDKGDEARGEFMREMSPKKARDLAGRKKNCKVRFCDWDQHIKYFTIMGESTDGKRFVGTLDSGEKISFSKRSQGWEVYSEGDEVYEAHAV